MSLRIYTTNCLFCRPQMPLSLYVPLILATIIRVFLLGGQLKQRKKKFHFAIRFYIIAMRTCSPFPWSSVGVSNWTLIKAHVWKIKTNWTEPNKERRAESEGREFKWSTKQKNYSKQLLESRMKAIPVLSFPITEQINIANTFYSFGWNVHNGGITKRRKWHILARYQHNNNVDRSI